MSKLLFLGTVAGLVFHSQIVFSEELRLRCETKSVDVPPLTFVLDSENSSCADIKITGITRDGDKYARCAKVKDDVIELKFVAIRFDARDDMTLNLEINRADGSFSGKAELRKYKNTWNTNNNVIGSCVRVTGKAF